MAITFVKELQRMIKFTEFVGESVNPHKVISDKLKDIKSLKNFSMPDPQERREMEAKRKAAEDAKKKTVKEEFDIEGLDESKNFEYHNELNPKLWSKDKLIPLVLEKLKENAADFWEYLAVPKVKLVDIELTGSNANFNWGPQSDIDLHLIVDMDKAKKAYGPMVVDYFNAKKQLWNTLRKVSIYNSTVEVYVQDSKEPHISSGVFSILNNEWKVEPHYNEPSIDDHAVCVKAYSFMCEIDAAIHANKPEFFENIMQRIKELRATGLKSPAAEFSVENLAFKTLRNNGYLQKIQDYKSDMKDKELSLMKENMENDYVMQSLADKDINAHIRPADGRLVVHKDNVAKAKAHLKKIGHGDVHVVSEGFEELEEGMVGHTTKSLSKEIGKMGWNLHNTSGGHDVFRHPKSRLNLAIPRHKGELSRPTTAKILKQAKMLESEVPSFKDFIGEASVYHSVWFKDKDGSNWSHHFDADSKEDAAEEKSSLKNDGHKVKVLKVAKNQADWRKQEHRDAAIKRLNEYSEEDHQHDQEQEDLMEDLDSRLADHIRNLRNGGHTVNITKRDVDGRSAKFVSVDKNGTKREHTITLNGITHHKVSNGHSDTEHEEEAEKKRGRGRPAGSKSGANIR